MFLYENAVTVSIFHTRGLDKRLLEASMEVSIIHTALL